MSDDFRAELGRDDEAPTSQPEAGVAPEPQAAGTAAAPTGAHLGETPGGEGSDEFADLEAELGDDPRKGAFLNRLKGQSAKLREAQERLTQLQQWEDDQRYLQEAGLTPGQLRRMAQEAQQRPAPQPTPADPEDAYQTYLAKSGVDPYLLTEERDALYREAFQMQQLREEFSQERERVREESFVARANAEFQQVQAKFPAFQGDLLRGLLADAHRRAYQISGQYPDLMPVAERLMGEIDRFHHQPKLAEYQTAKLQDARVPVTAGGNAPAPAPRKNPHRDMTPEEREEFFSAPVR